MLTAIHPFHFIKINIHAGIVSNFTLWSVLKHTLFCKGVVPFQFNYRLLKTITITIFKCNSNVVRRHYFSWIEYIFFCYENQTTAITIRKYRFLFALSQTLWKEQWLVVKARMRNIRLVDFMCFVWCYSWYETFRSGKKSGFLDRKSVV